MYDVIKRPIITEKTNGLVEIRTVNVHRKAKRMQRFEGFKPAYKKAIVRLAPGQTIDKFEI